MIIHHVIEATGINVPKLLNAFDLKTNWLISASSYLTEPKIKKNRDKIRQSANSIIFDSGVLGMAKRKFQSTLPAKGATRLALTSSSTLAFQSTLPAKGAT